QGRDQRSLAPDAVAVATEDRGADGPSDEADEVGPESRERARVGIGVGEIELAEYQRRDRAVDEEVIPLDGGADGRCDDGAAKLRAMFVGRQRSVCDC